jgi:predicted TIM-barrel fold metal-dependent hydrolase
VASILGSWGATSPIYFPSPADIQYGNDFLLNLQRSHPGRIRGYAVVNPNFQRHAQAELARCLDAGMIGIKLAASRRADDPLLDPICQVARERGVPVLHHIWQHRRRDYPGQEASDGAELGALAARHPEVSFLLAHIGGGGDWVHSLAAVRHLSNVYVDLSGSGVDGGMLEACLDAVGPERLLWGCDLTIDTGWAKLRYLEHLLSSRCSRPWTGSQWIRLGSATFRVSSGGVRRKETHGSVRWPRGMSACAPSWPSILGLQGGRL